VQERCAFQEGDLRVITLESQPAHVQRQQYRIYDAASGLIEEGWVNVADMVARGPWLEESWDFPVEVTRGTHAERRRPRRLERRDRRRLGPERPGVRSRARARGRQGHGARGRGHDRRRCAHERADRAGVLHDDCSAVHPMLSDPHSCNSLDLGRHGLEWCWPEVDLAHPLDDGSAGVECTGRLSGQQRGSAMTGRLAAGLRGAARGLDMLKDDFFRPILHVPSHPLRLARFGAPAALPATALARAWKSDQARALFGGVAAHALSPLTWPMSSSVGMA